MRRGESGGAGPRRFLRFRWNVPHAALFARALFFAAGRMLSSPVPPAAPFLPAAEEMGERTPPKTHGLWNSFRPISMRWEKVPQGIDREPTLAAADMVGGGYWRDYRFRRLSNRALAAVSGKCRRAGSLETCGFKQRFWSLLGLRPKATRARGARNSPRRRERSERRQWRMQGGERVAAVKISSVRRQAAQKFWAPQQCTLYK